VYCHCFLANVQFCCIFSGRFFGVQVLYWSLIAKRSFQKPRRNARPFLNAASVSLLAEKLAFLNHSAAPECVASLALAAFV
jgi:hypothetical protein